MGLPASTCPVMEPSGRAVGVGDSTGVAVSTGVKEVGVAVSTGVKEVGVAVSTGVDEVGVAVSTGVKEVGVGVSNGVGVCVAVGKLPTTVRLVPVDERLVSTLSPLETRTVQV